jgi:hypothetical protein
MQARIFVWRAVALAACLLALGAACASTKKSSPTSPASTSTTNPLNTPNSIPFEVGARAGLPNGWIVQIVKVHRPYADPRLPTLPSGRRYVALDLLVDNEGTTTETVNAELFWLGDSERHVDRVVAVPGRPNGLDGRYPPKTIRTGRLVFDVPAKAELRMVFEGARIGTQFTIFNVVPPTVSPGP